MIKLNTLLLYYNTIKYLKFSQIFHRILYIFKNPKIANRAAPQLRKTDKRFITTAKRRCSMIGPSTVEFLNQKADIQTCDIWNSDKYSKLWLYNLHYFDDLNSNEAETRHDWHCILIKRWIIENPPAQGTGWEPYPLSIRIINWVKWALNGNDLNTETIESLAEQTRYLYQRLEYHILGNHLFVNAKALIFAGIYFDGHEANKWIKKGFSILNKEIPEQILADGGHFERSTMYHSLAYEDMLDLANLMQLYPVLKTFCNHNNDFDKKIESMGFWLHSMCHPDGEISFFNDAAVGIAPSPDGLFRYAETLGYMVPKPGKGVTELKESGYIRVDYDGMLLIIDVAPVGPDYLPGHAHADTLSYELSLGKQRFIVNSGTSCYGSGVDRDYERSTSAHNTLEINGINSSEVWAGFRVGRRAHPIDISISKIDGAIVSIAAAHNGYKRLPGRPVHRRNWVLYKDRLDITDFVEGGFETAVSRIHLHPDILLKAADNSGVMECNGKKAIWQSNGFEVLIESSEWYPEFGVSRSSNCISMKLDANLDKVAGTFGLVFH